MLPFMAKGAFEERVRRFGRCRDLLAGSVLGGHCNDDGSRCVCLHHPSFFGKAAANEIYRALLDLLKTHGAPIARSRESRAPAKAHQYVTACFTKCRCCYEYPGTGKHIPYQYGQHASEAPRIISQIEQALCSKLDLDQSELPDCWVVNSYDPGNFIDWHTDEVPGPAKEFWVYGLAPRSAQWIKLRCGLYSPL